MLKTAMIFTDKMVLQQEKPIVVWGCADPGSRVFVALDVDESSALTDNSGRWRVTLEARGCATGLTMTIKTAGEQIVLHDICVGEVWLAGGQSNMEFHLGFEQHFEQVLQQTQPDTIRFFDYPEVAYEGELDDFDYRDQGFWRGCGAEDLGHYSAVGYYFAQSLTKDLQVPIGIIGCNWGGTPACAWMDPNRLIGTDGEVWIQEYKKATSDVDMDAFLVSFKNNPYNDRTNLLTLPYFIKCMKEGFTREEQLESQGQLPDGVEVPSFYFERRPGGLYETMLKKIVPFPVRGVIWYQGETDGDYHAEVYETVFRAMIENWRDLWQEELPFLYVQLAPFQEWMELTGKKYGIVRKCQDNISRSVPNVWMATSGDVGMRWDVHPKNKKPIGERLALLARGHVYGEEILCDAPAAVSATQKGQDIEVVFQNAEGLMVEGDELQAMQAVMGDGTVQNVTCAEIASDKLILPGLGDVKKLRFAMEDYCQVNLYNRANIPAKPFVLNVMR